MSDTVMENEALAEITDTPPEVEGAEAEDLAAKTVDDTAPAEEMPHVDYEALIKEDVTALKAEFPELGGINDILDLNNPLRYAALRDLGLSPAEAYLATAKRVNKDTRAHLRSAHGRNASSAINMMSAHELAAARELFPGKNDAELQRLYKRVSK